MSIRLVCVAVVLLAPYGLIVASARLRPVACCEQARSVQDPVVIRDADGRERIFIGMNRNGYPAIEMKSSRGARCFNLVVKDPAEAVALLGPEDLRSGALMLYAASGPGELRGAGMRAYSSAAEESGVALMDLRLSEEGRYSHDFESADGEQRISITSDGDGATFSLEEGGGKLSLSSAPQLSMAVEGGETVRIAP